MFVKLAWVAINVNYRVMWYMIINCTGFMDVNMNRMFSVSSNVSLDPGLVCDENFKNHGYFEGRDRGGIRALFEDYWNIWYVDVQNILRSNEL